jgi:hypothetical protein
MCTLLKPQETAVQQIDKTSLEDSVFWYDTMLSDKQLPLHQGSLLPPPSGFRSGMPNMWPATLCHAACSHIWKLCVQSSPCNLAPIYRGWVEEHIYVSFNLGFGKRGGGECLRPCHSRFTCGNGRLGESQDQSGECGISCPIGNRYPDCPAHR